MLRDINLVNKYQALEIVAIGFSSSPVAIIVYTQNVSDYELRGYNPLKGMIEKNFEVVLK